VRNDAAVYIADGRGAPSSVDWNRFFTYVKISPTMTRRAGERASN